MLKAQCISQGTRTFNCVLKSKDPTWYIQPVPIFNQKVVVESPTSNHDLAAPPPSTPFSFSLPLDCYYLAFRWSPPAVSLQNHHSSPAVAPPAIESLAAAAAAWQHPHRHQSSPADAPPATVEPAAAAVALVARQLPRRRHPHHPHHSSTRNRAHPAPSS